MANDCEELFVSRLDEYIDRYAEEVGYVRVEGILQERAQDMREMAAENGDVETITAEDIAEYDGE